MLGLLTLLAGCEAEAPSGFESADQRIDGSPEAGIQSRSPQLCMTGDEATVVWSDDRLGAPMVWLNHSADAGQTWGETVGHVDEGVAPSSDPTLACQPGAAVVAWEDTRDGDLGVPNIYARSSMSAGANWLAASARLGDDEWGWFDSHAARAYVGGRNVYVVWQDARYGAYDIFFSASADFGATWSPAVRLDWDDAGSSWSGNPTLAADGEGRVVVAWEDRRNGETDVYVTTSLDAGTTWSDDFRVDTGDEKGAAGSYSPKLALEGQEVVLVWSDLRSGALADIYMNRSVDAGATWLEASVRVDSDAPGASDSVEPQVVLRGGVTHVAWREARNITYDIYYRQGTGGAFGAYEQRLNLWQGDQAHAFEPRLVVDGLDVVVAWADERHSLEGGNTDLFYTWSDDGGTSWPEDNRRINSLAGGSTWSRELQVALAGGRLAAVWTDSREGDDDLYATSLALGESASTPEGVP